MSAGRTRHFLADVPLLDWLERHGRAKGFAPDDEIDDHDTQDVARAEATFEAMRAGEPLIHQGVLRNR